jgi:uncharacterized membrane protein YbhN (UPF0104 family)
MRRLASLAAMLLATLIGLVGVAVVLYGGYLAAFTTEDGNRPLEMPGFGVSLVGLAVLSAAYGLGKLIEHLLGTEDFDPTDDFLVAGFVLSSLLFAAGGVWIVLQFV